MNTDETIVALSTPVGRSGIGVVRLSGPLACAILEKMIRVRTGTEKSDELKPSPLSTPRHATLVDIVNPSSQDLIDEAVVTFFQGPNSYTGDDLIEICCHGSPVVLEQVIRLAMDSGARMAEPGEFTLRAFLNGRVDLAQAEAIHDLIEAKTAYQAQVAIQQAHGSLSKMVSPFKERLVDLISTLEAGIDFAEDDVPVMEAAALEQRLKNLIADLAPILESFSVGRIIREGLSLAIVGRPNVGKSSLFNRLLSSERSIVTAIPGTTRDVVSESAQIHGIPVRLVDTAGIRESTDAVEREGVSRSYAALAECDLVLLVLDVSEPLSGEDRALMKEVEALAHLLVFNKTDLPRQIQSSSKEFEGWTSVSVSAKTGAGIEELLHLIFEKVTGHSSGDLSTNSMITNLRHQRLLTECRDHVHRALEEAQGSQPHEIVLLNLYAAMRALDTITGATTVEEILGNMFSKFCVGK